ncbi:hypothetical protein [Nocardioides antri]|uniref:Uncharacterized protein n=1 Tax=Nocardioides antri TaxID=2607659 RepID=A0A5B1LZ26_9ACTN|nr:hypothetical protein [Nocardioides antri]KAA1425882.1 hypothetical protein F0U47_16170 [Nocardioides antri]
MDLSDVIETLRSEGYDVKQPLPGTLQVEGRFLNPERIALRAAGEAGDTALAVWAVSRENDWTLVGWKRPDLVTINQRGRLQRWRHRRIPPAMRPDAQTFLEGGASPHDIVTTPKHRPTDAAREVLAGLGIEAPEPPGWEPPPPPPVPVAPVAAPKPKRVRTAAPKPATARKPEPVTKVCPTCFMALPATGICDNCG